MRGTGGTQEADLVPETTGAEPDTCFSRDLIYCHAHSKNTHYALTGFP